MLKYVHVVWMEEQYLNDRFINLDPIQFPLYPFYCTVSYMGYLHLYGNVHMILRQTLSNEMISVTSVACVVVNLDTQ